MPRLVAVCLVVIALAVPASASAGWTRFSTDHFVFISDASEPAVRETARQLEQFRAVIGQLFSEAVTIAPVPTTVIVFRDDQSFAPFRPMFEGKPVAVAGYFTPGEDVNYIAVNLQQGTTASPVVFHEYTHFLLRNAFGELPLWVNEGLAQFYQTFRVEDGGRSAIVGAPDAMLQRLLDGQPTLLSMTELMAVDHGSSTYHEGDRRSVFYAESWALVHYLALGSPARSGQLQAFVAAIADGQLERDAFQRVFGADDGVLERELRRYVRAVRLNALRVPLTMATPEQRAPALGIPDDEAAGLLGDLLARLNRPADARAYLRRVLDQHPDAALATMALGLLELRSGNEAAALPLLERAAALAPGDAAIQSAYGRALTVRANLGRGDEDDLRARARSALSLALNMEPTNVSVAVTLAEVEMGDGTNPSRAIELMRQAVGAAPGRAEYRLMLAQALAMNGDFAQAIASLRPLLAAGGRPDLRDAARRVLARIAAVRDAERALDGQGRGTVAPAAPFTRP